MSRKYFRQSRFHASPVAASVTVAAGDLVADLERQQGVTALLDQESAAAVAPGGAGEAGEVQDTVRGDGNPRQALDPVVLGTVVPRVAER